MFDFSIWEIAIVIAALIIFLKPEDLPVVLRNIGSFFSKIKEFGEEISDIFKEAEHEAKTIHGKIIGEDGKEHITYNVEHILNESESQSAENNQNNDEKLDDKPNQKP